MSASRLLTSARRTARRYEAELRASQSFLATEVGRGGWLNLGQFRWRNVTPGRAARATFGVLTPLVIGFATHHVEYGTFAALGALPAGMVSFQGVTRTRVLLVASPWPGMTISTFVGGAAAFGVPWAPGAGDHAVVLRGRRLRGAGADRHRGHHCSGQSQC